MNGERGEEVGRRLLRPEEACKVLGVSRRWLDRHGRTLPFRIELGHRTIRYDSQGLWRWIAQRRNILEEDR